MQPGTQAGTAGAVAGAFATATAAQIAMLGEYDFYVVIDGSASMSKEDMPGGKSRWNYAKEQMGAFGRDAGHIDSDGITVILVNQSKVSVLENQSGDAVENLFDTYAPNGSTPLGEALQAVNKIIAKSSKKAFVLISTDGEPDNKDLVAETIRSKANSIASDDQCTYLFVQVGHDAGATAYLKGLDDNLKGAKFDIVDAIPIEEAMTFSNFGTLVLKAIDD